MGGACSRQQPTRVIIQGLDCAGKTTLLYKLKLGEVVTTIPTIGFNVETIESAGLEITAWDLGGRDKVRPLYRHYYPGTGGFIYILDSADVERLDDAFDELNRMIIQGDECRDKVLMVLANKQDLENALSASEIESRLLKHIDKNVTGVNLAIFVMPCSVTSKDDSSMWSAFNYFVKMIKMKKEGTLENGLIPSAWEKVEKEAEKDVATDDISMYHKLKNSVFKSPLLLLKSILFY